MIGGYLKDYVRTMVWGFMLYFALIVFQEDGGRVSIFFRITVQAINSYFEALALTFVSFSEF